MKFEKISYTQFKKDDIDIMCGYDQIKLPHRATKSSAGYDIYSVIGATGNSREFEAYQEGIIEGKRMMSERIDLPLAQTLEELFDRGFESDFNKFKEITGGIVYDSDENGQLSMIFIDNVDELGEYYQNELLSVDNESVYQRPIIKVN